MEASPPLLDAVPAASRPLKIVVSATGQLAALKALVAQSVPVLRNPEAFTVERRIELAHRLAKAIQPRGVIRESDDQEEPTSLEDPDPWLEETP
jgi:hypothetical protein